MTLILRRISIIVIASSLALFAITNFVSAQNSVDAPDLKKIILEDNLHKAGSSAGLTDSTYTEVDDLDIDIIIGTIINRVLSFLAIVFIIMVIYGGIRWMTAGGNEEDVTTAKDTIRRAIIGLAITASAFVITKFVMLALSAKDVVQ